MKKKLKTVFVPMSADILHIGHINILKKAKRLGFVIVGLMSDKGIASYKKSKPLIKFKDRKQIVQSLKYVDKIITLNGLHFVKTSKKYKFDFVVHGDDWKKGPQATERLKLIDTVKMWGGQVVEYKYTKGVSSSYLKNKLKQ